MFKVLKLSEEHHKVLKEYAKSEGRTMKHIIELYIDSLPKDKKYGVRLKVDNKK